jgi:RNA polymerase sigma-70 factor (ECF subfamily)
VRSLPGKGKEAYLLNREQGLSVAEIAEKLHLSPKTVEGHITHISRLVRIYVEKGLLPVVLFLLRS